MMRRTTQIAAFWLLAVIYVAGNSALRVAGIIPPPCVSSGDEAITARGNVPGERILHFTAVHRRHVPPTKPAFASDSTVHSLDTPLEVHPTRDRLVARRDVAHYDSPRFFSAGRSPPSASGLFLS